MPGCLSRIAAQSTNIAHNRIGFGLIRGFHAADSSLHRAETESTGGNLDLKMLQKVGIPCQAYDDARQPFSN